MRQGPPGPGRPNNSPLSQAFLQGLLLHQQGRLDEARRAYEAALRHDSCHFDSLYNLGVIELQHGEFESAAKRFRKALHQRPQSAEAEYVLGFALRALKCPDDAVPHFRKAIAIKPDFGEAHYNLAGALREANRPIESIAHYEKALVINPNHVDGHYDFATVLQPMGRLNEAIAHYDKVIALKPDHAFAHSNRGFALREIGRLEDARRSFETAVALSPRCVEFHYGLAFSKRVACDDPQWPILEDLARDVEACSAEDQTLLHFAMAKAYDDVEKYEQSVPHMLAGNALKRNSIPYSEADTLGALERIREMFSAGVMEEREGLGHPSETPVFIVGMPRSGSTLVEQILASHPDVFGAGELTDFAHAVAGLDGPEGIPIDVDGEELRKMGARYLSRVGADTGKAARITDKMLANFRFVGLIHLALPNARIIHTRRHPADTCLSCFSHLFALGQAFTYDLTELAHYYRAYENLMKHWREVLPQSTMIDVQYENVVADLEREARRVIRHCGLEWDDRCLEFYRAQRPVKTASVTQVRQPIYQSSIGRWRHYRDMLKPLFEALGSSPDEISYPP